MSVACKKKMRGKNRHGNRKIIEIIFKMSGGIKLVERFGELVVQFGMCGLSFPIPSDNFGGGLDYKYEKIFSLMISPFSYKYIYVNPITEPVTQKAIDPNLFGIKTGQNVLSEIGSSFKATYSAPITKEIQLDSRFSFYTNYQKVEIDWEIVANMSINRFLSTRISFNPRYDNTVLEKDGSMARLQFKPFLSVGFSHTFL